jgi:hypothetical protein
MPALVAPPKRIERPKPMSYAIAAPTKAGGDTDGVLCVQVAPFHSHVSETLDEGLLAPPNNTLRSRAES